jgi:CRISPR-associated helicase Cas3/CRISPR-associated endonuclease Cas3-HD
MKYYAHSSDNPEQSWQEIIEHSKNTATIAANYSSKFNAKEFGYICGLLHDIGKYSQEFQNKLKGEIIRVDHSTAGAQESCKLYGKEFGRIIAYCLAGHHSGLMDFGNAAMMEGTLNYRLHKNIEDYSAYKNELEQFINKSLPKLPIKPIKQNYGFSFSFFVRMLFSCLVDADFLDTENYLLETVKLRGKNKPISILKKKFDEFLSSFNYPKTKINAMRQEILESCLNMANKKTGLFTLTVPTGGGKTYSSFAFALKHAIENNLEKIIYVIPYTSIIEQNAALFKNAIGYENVLEHHSNFQFNEKDSEYLQKINEKLKLASENWDIPVIVTTNVQFFESLFSNRSSKCRKIHNLSKSVLIFDEAQMLPIQYLKPCLLSVAELITNYGTTAVFCTATQPSINQLLPSTVKPIEMMKNPKKLYNDFKKVEIIRKGETKDENLVSELNDLDQVLCIVNTRKHAREIFNKLKEIIDNSENHIFHLSSLMCPIHRQNALSKIKECLINKKSCKVISTQLIEAGVDIDFPVVYRSMAGIDSIIQSAGRCNREGKSKSGKVFVFKPSSDLVKTRGYLDRTASVADMVFRKYSDPISLEAIDYYFILLYDIETELSLDREKILECFEENYKQLEFNFRTAAEKFKLINENRYPIIIPYVNSNEDKKTNSEAIIKKILNEAEFTPYPTAVVRKLQPYIVQVYEYEYKALLKNRMIKTINDNFDVLDNFSNNYSQFTGLKLPEDNHGEAIFV